jgi:hypothetical protein
MEVLNFLQRFIGHDPVSKPEVLRRVRAGISQSSLGQSLIKFLDSLKFTEVFKDAQGRVIVVD